MKITKISSYTSTMAMIRPVEWIPDSPRSLVPGKVRILDQTQLPVSVDYIETADLETIWHAIKILQVRGAPAIGIAAAMGVAAVAQYGGNSTDEVVAEAGRAAQHLATSRPTAVNLFWALDRMTNVAAANANSSADKLKTRLVEEAIAILNEDDAMCRAIGEYGASLLSDNTTILTHCNAGGLATSGFGTALAPVYVATEQGKRISVYADETRPLLQGSRLTAWELTQAGIDVTVICDNVAAQVMKEKRIDAVLVGADRIAANGDAANKIGTYGVAVLAKTHEIPFYVLAPTSTIDPKTPNGDAIPIEERSRDEVINGFGRMTGPANVKVYSPAFDVTPVSLITAIICEKGIVRDNFVETLKAYTSNDG